MIDILIDRVEHHKDKFISPILYNELLGMEIKRNGKVEHSDSTHDDQIFSYLMALYVWYEGTNLMERYGIKKSTIKTDENIDEEAIDFSDGTVEIVEHFNTKDDAETEIEKTVEEFMKSAGPTLDKFLLERHEKEKRIFQALLATPLGEKAYRERYNIPEGEPIQKYTNGNGDMYDLPENLFDSFYNPSDAFFDKGTVSDRPTPQAVPASEISSLEDENYQYRNFFNF